MLGSFKIGRIAGIEIAVHWSWLFIFVLVTSSFATGILEEFFPEWSDARRWGVGVIIAAIFFASILLHELSHSLVAKAKGIPVKGITLFVFGGVSNLGREAQSAGEEFQIAIVGPLTSLAVGAVVATLWAALRGPPLGGGRVFRSIVWGRNRDLLRGTRAASRMGEYVAYLLMAGGAIQFIVFNPIGGIWMFLIGLFLRSASVASYEQLVSETALRGVTAAGLASTAFGAG